ncbi:MAG TPA: DMT family transporter [Bacteroidota bacterium]|nr:DMT family transporter [Bacteroidota bacterium]
MIGEISALMTAVVWSFSSIMFAGAIRRIGSVQVNVGRLVIAAVLLLLTVAAAGLSLRLSVSQFSYLAISGLIGLVFGDSFLFKSFQVNGARISMLIMSLAPAISAVMAFMILGESLSLWGIVGMAVTTIGIAIVVVAHQQSTSTKVKITRAGLVYGFFGALGQGAGLVFARLAFDEGEINGFVGTLVRITASIVVLLPLSLITRRITDPIKPFVHDTKALLLTTGGAIFGPYLGITFSLIAITYTKVGIAATLMATVPIMMLPLVKLVYKEKLSWHAVVGACVAVGGVAILFLR